ARSRPPGSTPRTSTWPGVPKRTSRFCTFSAPLLERQATQPRPCWSYCRTAFTTAVSRVAGIGMAFSGRGDKRVGDTNTLQAVGPQGGLQELPQANGRRHLVGQRHEVYGELLSLAGPGSLLVVHRCIPRRSPLRPRRRVRRPGTRSG